MARTIGSVLLARTSSHLPGQSNRRPSSPLIAASAKCSFSAASAAGSFSGASVIFVFTISYFGSEAWINKNATLVRAFVNAINRGIDAHNANPEEAKATIAKHTGLKPELFKDMALPAFEKKLLESDLQPMLDVALRYKFIDRKFPLSEVVSPHARA